MLFRYKTRFITTEIFLGLGVFLVFSLFISALSTAVAESTTEQFSERLNILTSFPPEFYTPFLENFSHLHPDIQISILNKKATAAIDEILRGNNRNFDLFWSSSADAFDLLNSKQKLISLKQKHDYPLIAIKGLRLTDPEGNYHGFALSGVGWMWNDQYLRKEGLPIPKSWEDLTNPVYYGHIAMSTPSRSGTTHLIVENFLQQLGWEKGWSQLLQMAGNLATVTARSFSVPEGVNSGRFGVGLVIDFLSHADQNQNIQFCYGKPVFLVPAEIAGLKNGQNPKAAEQFLSFILSTKGQKILLQPEINRIPISRKLLSGSHRKVARLLEEKHQKELRAYNVHLSRQRYHLVNQLFDQMITFRLRERRQLWKKMQDLITRYGTNEPVITAMEKKVLYHFGRVPVSSSKSQNRDFLKLFGPLAVDEPVRPQQRELINSWNFFIDTELEQIKNLLTETEKLLRKREGKTQ